MTVITRNVRGINTDFKMGAVINLLNKYKHSILGLLENKLTVKRIDYFMMKMQLNWMCIHNNDNISKGRVLVLWDKNIWNITEISHSK